MLRHLKSTSTVLALLLGAIASGLGARQALRWDELSQNNRAYYALLLFFGLVLFGEGLFAARDRKYPGLHLMIIAGTAAALAGVQFVGLATGSVLFSLAGHMLNLLFGWGSVATTVISAVAFFGSD